MIITKIIALTNNMNRLQLVTVSMDGLIKILEIEQGEDSFVPELVHEFASLGQIINAAPLHGPTGVFIVSAMNEETEECWIQVWKRKMQRACFGPYSEMTLDMCPVTKSSVIVPHPEEGGASLAILNI
mmetsp:Transcript_24611/g.38227  ORF Transcript_24611/g.38227 Transcript_24611/m.38227 type:complete len:128 (+) Transcript_24611:2226-2609(+)